MLFIISDRMGRKQSKLARHIAHFIESRQEIDAKLVVTQHKQHLQELTENFAWKAPDGIVLVAGGDGSLSEAANVLANAGTGTALGAIPYGTGNDFCKTLYHGFKLDDFLDNLPRAEVRPIDLMLLEGDIHPWGQDTMSLDQVYSLNVTSFGFDSHVLNSTYELLKRHPKLKRTAYFGGVLMNLFNLKSRELELNCDGLSFTRDSLLLALCNGGFYGNGFNPAPLADLEDGFLNYCQADAMLLHKFLTLVRPYRNGSVEGRSGIHMGQFQSFSVRPVDGEPVIANYDGELFTTRELQVSVVASKLPFAFVKVKADSFNGGIDTYLE